MASSVAPRSVTPVIELLRSIFRGYNNATSLLSTKTSTTQVYYNFSDLCKESAFMGVYHKHNFALKCQACEIKKYMLKG
ncbi:hypothetical protein TSAR_006811 [Trichomalopsis sarcophagae]|uniref:Uncharacterized protein n=1 Tax=Trichomalopsis sarcophagae TaxID=543379 RepID=A0A232F388_9HYME|nr:hypothetical protein TSAR_006811 [Trichomalopsis sarcophagae]